jgi:class 3 adenylate cyclase/tetratricopeptide (TPR) repeat protein
VEERRNVTALFADLVGSTSLGERLDPEVMRGLVGRFFEMAARQIQLHGGTVEKFSGDAVLGVFGLKEAHEDDPERAVRAAVAIQKGTETLAEDATSRHRVAFAVRFGVEAGEVVVGDPFGGATMATGDPLNLAARLEQQAKPGEIVVGPAVHALTRGAVSYEPVGELQLAGKKDAIRAWRVLKTSDQVGGARGVEGLSAPLTGRDEEVALLQDAARRTRAERKTVLFSVLGAPGVGKSRLIREFAAGLQGEGTRVLRGRCLPYGDAITYWAMAEMTWAAAGIGSEMTSDQALDQLRSVAPDAAVADRLAFAIGLRKESPVGGEGLDREIAWAFRRLVETVAAEAPVLAIFEDIHWAEPRLLDLIEYVASWVRGAPLMIVCLTRPELLDHRPGWGGGRIESTRIQLDPLSRSESAQLVSALLTVEALPQSLRDRIVERSEGNPLFVEEVLRMLIDEHVIVRQDGRWVALPNAGDVRVPETVEALIRARLDTLPRPERSLLQTASVIGRVFDRAGLTALGEGAPDRHLEDAVMRDLIIEEGPAQDRAYRFKHILIRDVAYAGLPKARRAELHERFARWLAESAGDRRAEFAEIEAYHLETAVQLQIELHGKAETGLRTAAVDALEAASRKAGTREDFRAALGFAERCLAIGPEPEEHRLEVEWLRVEAVWRLSDIRRAGALGARLAADAERIGRIDLQGRALFAQCEDAWLGMGQSPSADRGGALAAQAHDLLTRSGDLVYLFNTALYIGWGGWFSGNLDIAWERFAEAADFARRVGNTAHEAEATAYMANVRGFQGRASEQADLYQRATTLAASSVSRVSKARLERMYGAIIARTESIDAGCEKIAAAFPVLEESGDRVEVGSALVNLAELEIQRGRPAAAIPLLERAVSLWEEVGHRGFLPEAERTLAEALLAMGDHDGAEPHALRAVEMRLPDDTFTVASTTMVLGRVRDAQGRGDEAKALLQNAIGIIETTDYRTQLWFFYLPMAEFYLRRGRLAEGDRWVEKAREIARLISPRSPALTVIDERAKRAQAAATGLEHGR